MNSASGIARDHYATADTANVSVLDTLSRALAEEGKFTAESFAALDQFHVGGLDATLRLGELLRPVQGNNVLDAGSGLGGPSRVIAGAYRCHVTGVDLSPQYIEISRRIADRLVMADCVAYEVGDLLDLSFGDGQFDCIYSQHVVMNIADRAGAYAELYRVLKPGGGFAFYDIISTDSASGPIYPMPWAHSHATSFLLDETATRSALASAGLPVSIWIDVTSRALNFLGSRPPSSSGGANLATVMGPRFSEMTQNLARNLRDRRLAVVMGRCESV